MLISIGYITELLYILHMGVLIRKEFNVDNRFVERSQRFQIRRLGQIIEILWYEPINHVYINYEGDEFFLIGPDNDAITIRDILENFGYDKETIEFRGSIHNNLTWNDIIDMPVKDVPAAQFDILP